MQSSRLIIQRILQYSAHVGPQKPSITGRKSYWIGLVDENDDDDSVAAFTAADICSEGEDDDHDVTAFAAAHIDGEGEDGDVDDVTALTADNIDDLIGSFPCALCSPLIRD